MEDDLALFNWVCRGFLVHDVSEELANDAFCELRTDAPMLHTGVVSQMSPYQMPLRSFSYFFHWSFCGHNGI